MFGTASDFLFKFGIVGAAQSSVSRWALGYAVIHPGYFISALICSALVKVGATQLQEQSILSQLEVMSTHFSIVTSNLMNDYSSASEQVASSFLHKDSLKLHGSIQGLLDAQNKHNEGTMRKFFDERDLDV